MGPVNLVGVAVSLGVLWLMFRHSWPARYDLAALPPPGSTLLAPRTCWAGAGLMAALLAGFFLAPGLGMPVSAVALLAAAIVLGISALERRVALGPVLRGAPWDVVLFSLGMYLVVYGVKNAGLTVWLAGLLETFAAHGAAATVFGAGGVIAALSAITNNLPAVLIGTLSIQEVGGVPPVLRELMVYANIVAADIGPKLTPIGSLATLLWLGLLRQKGIEVPWGEYLRLGLIATPPVLIAALLALWWRLGG